MIPVIQLEVYNDTYYVNAWISNAKTPTRLSAALMDSGYTGSAFIYKRLVEDLCYKYDIEPFDLSRPKPISAFDGRSIRPVR